MGLSGGDRKELESLIKAATKDSRVPIGLARRMVPSQGDIEDFAYGLISGMVIGNFMASFESRNGRQPDARTASAVRSSLANTLIFPLRTFVADRNSLTGQQGARSRSKSTDCSSTVRSGL